MTPVPRNAPRRTPTSEPDVASDPFAANRLLAALPHAIHKRFAPQLMRRALAHRQVIWHAGEPVREVLFPTSGAVSVLVHGGAQEAVEVALIGLEGVVGPPIVLPGSRSSTTAMVQLAGQGYSLAAELFLREVNGDPAALALMQRYGQARYFEVAQSVLCNAKHRLDRRLARWLLTCYDRVGSSEIGLTQEFMGQMLGVRRGSVSSACAALEATGAIRCRPSQVTVIDRGLLKDLSCSCYSLVAAEFARILEG